MYYIRLLRFSFILFCFVFSTRRKGSFLSTVHLDLQTNDVALIGFPCEVICLRFCISLAQHIRVFSPLAWLCQSSLRLEITMFPLRCPAWRMSEYRAWIVYSFVDFPHGILQAKGCQSYWFSAGEGLRYADDRPGLREFNCQDCSQANFPEK